MPDYYPKRKTETCLVLTLTVVMFFRLCLLFFTSGQSTLAVGCLCEKEGYAFWQINPPFIAFQGHPFKGQFHGLTRLVITVSGYHNKRGWDELALRRLKEQLVPLGVTLNEEKTQLVDMLKGDIKIMLYVNGVWEK